MPNVPRRTAQINLTRQTPEIRINPKIEGLEGRNLQIAGQSIQQVANTANDINDRFKAVENFNQYTDASLKTNKFFTNLKDQASQDNNLDDYENRYSQEINHFREEAIKGIKDQKTQTKFLSSFEQSALSTQAQIKNTYRKKLIDNQKVALSEQIDLLKESYYNSEGNALNQTKEAIKDALTVNSKMGIISREDAFDELKKIESTLEVDRAKRHAELNPDATLEAIEKGVYDFPSPDAKQEAINFANEVKKRNNAETDFSTYANILDMTVDPTIDTNKVRDEIQKARDKGKLTEEVAQSLYSKKIVSQEKELARFEKSQYEELKISASDLALTKEGLGKLEYNIETRLIEEPNASKERIKEIFQEEKENYAKQIYPDISGANHIPTNVYDGNKIKEIKVSPSITTPNFVFNTSSNRLEQNNKEGSFYTYYMPEKGVSVGFNSNIDPDEARVIIDAKFYPERKNKSFSKWLKNWFKKDVEAIESTKVSSGIIERGKFNTVEDANKYADRLHKQQERLYSNQAGLVDVENIKTTGKSWLNTVRNLLGNVLESDVDVVEPESDGQVIVTDVAPKDPEKTPKLVEGSGIGGTYDEVRELSQDGNVQYPDMFNGEYYIYEPKTTTGQRLADIGEAVTDFMNEDIGNISLGALKLYVDQVPTSLAGMLQAVGENPFRIGSWIAKGSGMPDITPYLPKQKNPVIVKIAKRLQQGAKEISQSVIPDAAIQKDDSGLDRFEKMLGNGIGSLSMFYGLGMMSGSSMMAGLTSGLSQFGSKYVQAMESGKDNESAFDIATVSGTVEGALESLGFNVFMSRHGGKVLSAAIGGFTEGLQETAQTGGEQALDIITGLRKNPQLGDVAQELGESFAIGFLMGAPANLAVQTAELDTFMNDMQEAGFSKGQAKQIAKNINEAVKKEIERRAVSDIEQITQPNNNVNNSETNVVQFANEQEKIQELEAGNYFLPRNKSTIKDVEGLKPATTPEELKFRIDQLNKFAQANAILRRTGGLTGNQKSKAVGQFVEQGNTGEVRLSGKYIQNEQDYVGVLAHELGHALEYNIVGSVNENTMAVFGDIDQATRNTIEQELIKVTQELEGDETVNKNKDYYMRPSEMLARYLEKMIVSPSNLQEIAPTATESLMLNAIKHPMLGEFIDATLGNIDRGQNKVLSGWADMKQIYQNILGNTVGSIAWNLENLHRAMQERAKFAIKKYLKNKFKEVKDDPSLLFRSAESILITMNGEPIFGTRDFVTAKTEEDKANLESIGAEYVADTMDKGKWYPMYAKPRYTAEQGKALFEQLSPEGQAIVKEFTAQRKEAKEFFNREVIKELYNVNGNIEGWVHHFWKDKSTTTTKQTKFKEKTAGSSKKRKGAEGYVEDLHKAIEKALIEQQSIKEWNEFIEKQFATVTKPLADGATPDNGWVEVIGDLKKGVGTKRDKKTPVIIQDGKSFTPKQPRYQMPKDIYNRYKLMRDGAQEASVVLKTLNSLMKYWRVNVLTHAGSASTNFISGGIQYGSKVLTDFYTELLSGQINFKRTKQDILAMFTALSPKGWADAPDWIFGGDLSNYYGQFTQSQGLLDDTIDAYADKALKFYGAIERYWKKVIALSENVSDLNQLNEIDVNGLKPPTQEEADIIAQINEQVDLYAYDYDNIPFWLQKMRTNVVGQYIKPFSTYPYKYFKMASNLATSVFDQTLPWQERTAKLLSLTTIMSVYAAISKMRKDEQETPEGNEDTPARLSPRGRLLITKDGEGKEIFVRTAKYPFLNLTDAGIAFIDGQEKAGFQIFTDMVGSLAPPAQWALRFFGYENEYSKYTPKTVLLGETAKQFVPGFRIFEDIAKGLDPYRRKPTNFIEAFGQIIPTTSEDLQRKIHGEVRTVEVPIEGNIRKRPGESVNRSTTDRELENNWQDVLLSSMFGTYFTRIDPDEAKAFKIRKEKNKQKKEKKRNEKIQ